MSKNYGTSSFFIFRTPCTTKDSQSTNKIYGWHQQAGFLFMRIICCYILAYWGTFTLIKGMKNVIVIIWLSRYSSRILKTMEKKYKIEYTVKLVQYMKLRSSHPEVFLEKGVLKICSKFTGKRPCQSAVSIKFLCKFIEIALWHWCSPVNLLHIFRTPFLKNTTGRLFLETFVTYFIWKY